MFFVGFKTLMIDFKMFIVGFEALIMFYEMLFSSLRLF